MSDAPPSRTAPLALWRVAQAFLWTLHALFGAPEDVAAQHTLMTKPYKLMLKWLRAGEALMRHLLLIEASAVAKLNARPLLHARRERAPRMMEFFPDKPEDWRVSFRCVLGPPASRRHRTPAPRTPPKRFFSAWPLAERYEALLRVFNDPSARAARLAHHLHARPHCAAALCNIPQGAPNLIGRESFAAIEAAAIKAHAAFNST